MANDQNIEETVKELLGRSIESMSDAEALQHIAAVVDRGADTQSSVVRANRVGDSAFRGSWTPVVCRMCTRF